MGVMTKVKFVSQTGINELVWEYIEREGDKVITDTDNYVNNLWKLIEDRTGAKVEGIAVLENGYMDITLEYEDENISIRYFNPYIFEKYLIKVIKRLNLHEVRDFNHVVYKLSKYFEEEGIKTKIDYSRDIGKLVVNVEGYQFSVKYFPVAYEFSSCEYEVI